MPANPDPARATLGALLPIYGQLGSSHALANSLPWPWSCRVAGALSSWPAVEIYEAAALLDVVSSTRLVAQVLRGARGVRVADGRRVIAWGRLPVSAGVPAIEFRGGRRRVRRQAVAPAVVTSWCWVAVASGRYDTVTVSYNRVVVRRRLRLSRSRP